jgi:hypothetical protein
MTKAKSVLRGHSESHATNILDANLRPDEAYTAYTMFFLPKIKFSLPVSIFTQEECRNIQAPALMQTLPLMRLNRHTARSIINGPHTYGGLMLPDIYAEQGLGQLKLLLGHLRVGDKTGKLILVSMSYLQLIIGSATPFFQLPYDKFAKWIDKSWLTSIWQFIHVTKLQIAVRQHYTPKLTSQGYMTLA